jgi:hypothetical protein
MCVICIAEKDRPSPGDVDKMWQSNAYGAGVSWTEKGAVHWKKGLTLAEIVAFSQEAELPYILHFRIPTAGGNDALLNHPFELGGNPAEKGASKRGVLFHNGHWGEWMLVRATLQASLRGQLPRGPWSDSRLMAYISRWGTDWLDDLRTQRVAVMTPTRIDRFGSWTESTKGSGLWYSNESWRTSFRGHYGGRGQAAWEDYWERVEPGIWKRRAVVEPVASRIPEAGSASVGSSAGGTGQVAGAGGSAGTPEKKASQPEPIPLLSSHEGVIREGVDSQGYEIYWIRAAQVGHLGTSKWNRFRKKEDGTLEDANFRACPIGLVLGAGIDPVKHNWHKRFATMTPDDPVQDYNSRAVAGFPTAGIGFTAPAILREGSASVYPRGWGGHPASTSHLGAAEKPDVLGVILDQAHRFFGVDRELPILPAQVGPQAAVVSRVNGHATTVAAAVIDEDEQEGGYCG